MNLQELHQLTTYFNADKKFVKDGYYRIRTLDANQYELAFLEAGPCGDTTVHPQITLHVTDQTITPVKLLDLATSPTRRLTRDEQSAELDEALVQLHARFLRAITQLDQQA